MNEERRKRYVQAKPIALAALELAEAKREPYVVAQCGNDEALADEVQWMIEAAEATVGCNGLSFLSTVPDVVGSTVHAESDHAYRILSLLGEGGGGIVYLAERVSQDGLPDAANGRVAIKFLRAEGLPGRELPARFREERRILSTLNHANIARLLDAGTGNFGRPFLVLEYVAGERIDHWCERHRSSIRERVSLFLKVCRAVHYAHQRLVIHRDIKPGNILVTDAGEPKLLDFGIARLLDHVGGVAATMTQTGLRSLTPAYASPEQLRGQPLGARADVWSLGVVLYQLVCGVRPFGDRDEVSAVRLSEVIDSGKLLPPSRRRNAMDDGSPCNCTTADLDAIVMKALRRDPEQRYPSVAALVADLRCLLASRPVCARRGATWHRVRTLFQRHPLGAASAGLALVVLMSMAVQQARHAWRWVPGHLATAAVATPLRDSLVDAGPGARMTQPAHSPAIKAPLPSPHTRMAQGRRTQAVDRTDNTVVTGAARPSPAHTQRDCDRPLAYLPSRVNVPVVSALVLTGPSLATCADAKILLAVKPTIGME